jgi:DNA-directed RNA polymerase specialized sigma24 family protein
VARARSGDRGALEDIIERHQAWIYNIAVRMLFHPQDAEDATQEILIKVLTRLSSFEGRSSFRTWLYRIVVNHVLNMRRGRVEDSAIHFRMYGEELDKTPDLDLPDPKDGSPDANLLSPALPECCFVSIVNSANVHPWCNLRCPAEVLEITAENFRQRLARARRDLRNFMNDKCGLVNQANPCRCVKKTRGFIQAGHVDPKNLLFVRERVCEVREAASQAPETRPVPAKPYAVPEATARACYSW